MTENVKGTQKTELDKNDSEEVHTEASFRTQQEVWRRERGRPQRCPWTGSRAARRGLRTHGKRTPHHRSHTHRHPTLPHHHEHVA